MPPVQAIACPTSNGSFVTFDGSNDLLSVAHDDEFNLTVFTLSLWVKQDVSRAQTLVCQRHNRVSTSALMATARCVPTII